METCYKPQGPDPIPREWDGGSCGRFRREGIYKYIQLPHYVIQQELTQHCSYP